jgi:hypothetical protein
MALRRSPKPGAFTAATLSTPLRLLTTSVANASPSTSSAMISSGRLVLATASRIELYHPATPSTASHQRSADSEPVSHGQRPAGVRSRAGSRSAHTIEHRQLRKSSSCCPVPRRSIVPGQPIRVPDICLLCWHRIRPTADEVLQGTPQQSLSNCCEAQTEDCPARLQATDLVRIDVAQL